MVRESLDKMFQDFRLEGSDYEFRAGQAESVADVSELLCRCARGEEYGSDSEEYVTENRKYWRAVIAHGQPRRRSMGCRPLYPFLTRYGSRPQQEVHRRVISFCGMGDELPDVEEAVGPKTRQHSQPCRGATFCG
ncbi:hypothetical protein PG988_007440 [Apiospora saccharicola]